ncbi:MAG: CoA transferase [Pseudomonadota bacterium]
MTGTATGPLKTIKVIDLTSVVLGPYATQTLGDMGADVIKIESPDGDIMRFAEPARSPGMGAVFLNTNRNKRSIVLDLKQSAARDVVTKLVSDADVFVHSMRPGAIDRLGLTYEAISSVRPDIIYCATWGFDSRGRYAGRPAYDDVIQGMSGLTDLPRLRSGNAPEFAPSIMADKLTGLTAAMAIVSALFHRAQTGEGQDVEVPMFETVTAFNLVEHLAGHAFEPPLGAMGYSRALSPERRPYRTADGYMAVLPYATRQWVSFFRAIGRPDVADDPMITDPATRIRNIDSLYRTIGEIMPTRTTAEWVEILTAADVPSVAVNRLEDLPSDPHLADIGFFPTYEHPSEGQLRTTSVPVQFGRTPGDAMRRHTPRLGEHTREVLVEAGYSEAEIADMLASGAAHTPPDAS